MYRQQVRVHYADGTTADTVLTQWAMSQWAMYAARQGLEFKDVNNPGLLGVTSFRFQACAELQRPPGTPKVSFEKWDATVDEVEVLGDAEQADPTQTAPSAG